MILQIVASVDGRISFGPNRTQWDDMADQRQKTVEGNGLWSIVSGYVKAKHQPQADILGSNSLIKADAPIKELPVFTGDATSLYDDYLPEDVLNRPGHDGWLVVVDGQGRLRSGFRGDGNLEWHMLHLVSHAVEPAYLAFLRSHSIPYLVSGEQQVDLTLVLTKLKEKLGISTAVTTAGGRLAGAMMRAGLIDEVNVVYRPMLIGGYNTPALFDSPDLSLDEWPAKLKLLSVHVEQDQVWLQYQVVEQ